MSFDFDAAVVSPFRMQPGLRRLAGGERHLTPAAPGGRHQREKLAVLAAFADEALLVAAGFDAVGPLCTLARQAAQEHPGLLHWRGRHLVGMGVSVHTETGEVQALEAGIFGTGDEVLRVLRSLPPAWRLGALLALCFEDDLALVDGRDGRLVWMAVALPSHWNPREKIGRGFAEVHAPVADNQALVASASPLMSLVTAGGRWERFVWNLTGHPRLHAHPARVDPEPFEALAGSQSVAAQTWWRTERQSFMPLAGHDRLACFTIRVAVEPLQSAMAHPEQARKLHDALASMSPAVRAYRGLEAVHTPLLQWLSRRAAEPAREPPH